VGLSLREQLLEEGMIPMNEHDWKMDMIVTPDEILVKQGEDWWPNRTLYFASHRSNGFVHPTRLALADFVMHHRFGDLRSPQTDRFAGIPLPYQ